jgi:hypothetical protein
MARTWGLPWRSVRSVRVGSVTVLLLHFWRLATGSHYFDSFSSVIMTHPPQYSP